LLEVVFTAAYPAAVTQTPNPKYVAPAFNLLILKVFATPPTLSISYP